MENSFPYLKGKLAAAFFLLSLKLSICILRNLKITNKNYTKASKMINNLQFPKCHKNIGNKEILLNIFFHV